MSQKTHTTFQPFAPKETLSIVERGWRKIGVLGFVFLLVYIVGVIKLIALDSIEDSFLFATYSILVAVYILSRFAISYFYTPQYSMRTDTRTETLPTITFVTPAKDEEDNIADTLRAMLHSDYPREKMEIITINDGSSDGTLGEMQSVMEEARTEGVSLTIIDWKKNRGKRAGMAEGVRRARGEIVIFIDSDSFVTPQTARELVKYFIEPEVAAVAGHADVHNPGVNLLTKMQAVRYFVAFKAYKSAEAIFGTVTCCSGCCSAYRRAYLVDIIDDWEKQTFLGVPCTYGDDRALTNYLLKLGYDAIYAPEAYSTTMVPEKWYGFLKQQMRWKKSWTRESLKASLFMWKRHPIMVFSFFLGVILPLLAPVVVVRALIWIPTATGALPYVYIGGLILMSMIYGAYYRLYRKDSLWVYGMFFSWFYSLVLVWQLPYAIAKIRDGSWGTR